MYAAEAQEAGELKRVIRTTAKSNWQAAAWLLERRFPSRHSLIPKLRPELQEEESATSLEARKAQITEAFAKTRGQAHRERDGE